jgi:16S rRNA (cytidine1402-2'-O)-methyltransferase
MKTGTLYLIPTPINSQELSEILLPEYIKIVGKLKNFIVETPKNARRNLGSIPLEIPIQQINFVELSEHTKDRDIKELLRPLIDGEDAGLMSDAGLPSVADPGYRIVRVAQELGITVVPFVGPSSIFLALMASGLNGQNFAFNGYLPKDSIELKKEVKSLESLVLRTGQTQIFMDTPYRNQKLFESVIEVCSPSTYLCIAFNIGGEDGYIKTKNIFEWRRERIILPKSPCLFLINKG